MTEAGKHPRSHQKYIQYGTAGFRTKADLLDHVSETQVELKEEELEDVIMGSVVRMKVEEIMGSVVRRKVEEMLVMVTEEEPQPQQSTFSRL